MAEKGSISRRQFVASAITVAAASSVPHRALAEAIVRGQATPQSSVSLIDSPTWKDQGIENLTKSPHAKLRDIPVHAVTITGGFWGPRR